VDIGNPMSSETLFVRWSVHVFDPSTNLALPLR
jgi:hypothetical protein